MTTNTNTTAATLAPLTPAEIDRYCQQITAVEDRSTGYAPRTMYYIGENFQVEITHCTHDLADRKGLMRQWKRLGYISRMLPTSISLDTYYTADDGTCRGWYNPTVKLHGSGCRLVIDFSRLLEDTPENRRALLAECIRLRDLDIRIRPAG